MLKGLEGIRALSKNSSGGCGSREDKGTPVKPPQCSGKCVGALL